MYTEDDADNNGEDDDCEGEHVDDDKVDELVDAEKVDELVDADDTGRGNWLDCSASAGNGGDCVVVQARRMSKANGCDRQ